MKETRAHLSGKAEMSEGQRREVVREKGRLASGVAIQHIVRARNKEKRS
jgi:hypothetical protein